MALLSYAPFEDTWSPRPKAYTVQPQIPVGPVSSDNTECNYVAMFFIGGVILMGIMDSLRK
jgi:hypothetical protein